MRRPSLVMLVLGCAGFLLAGCDCEGPSGRLQEFTKSDSAVEAARKAPPMPAGPPRPRIGVIPMTIKTGFWRGVRTGVVNATQELKGIRTTWEGPANGVGAQTQAAIIASFVENKASGIIVAPVDAEALLPSVQAARKAGIPVLALLSELGDPEACIGLVATDNAKVGELGATRLAEVLGPKGGKVVLLRGVEHDPVSEAREKAFLDTIAKRSGVEVVSSDQHAGKTVDTAASTALTILNKFRPGQVNGVFCSNEAGSTGMLRELKETNRLATVRMVGVNCNDQLAEEVMVGNIDGLVLENTLELGSTAVKVMVAHLRGEPAPKQTLVPPVLATQDLLPDVTLYMLMHPPKE